MRILLALLTYMLLIYVYLPFWGIVILVQLLFLMQIIYSWFRGYFLYMVVREREDDFSESFFKYFLIERNPNLLVDDPYPDEPDEYSIDFLIKTVEKPKSDDFFEQYEITELLETFVDFIYIYQWFLLPICIYFSLIYILHGILGLYSVYVDYFQKNPDHVESIRAIVIAAFVFYLLLFIFCSIIYFFCFLYLHYIIWFLFI